MDTKTTLMPLEYMVSFLMHFRFIFVIGVAFVLFVLMYTYIPSVKLKLLYQVPGKESVLNNLTVR